MANNSTENNLEAFADIGLNLTKISFQTCITSIVVWNADEYFITLHFSSAHIWFDSSESITTFNL